MSGLVKNNDELPEGWEKCSLVQLSNVRTGKRDAMIFPRKNGHPVKLPQPSPQTHRVNDSLW